MGLPAEKLAEIDEELAAFGKSDEALAGVIERAVALAASLAGDDALGSLLEGRQEALAAARQAARDALPVRPTAAEPVAAFAPASSTEPFEHATAGGGDGEAVGSGLIEIPDEELRNANLPPVLDPDESEPPPEALREGSAAATDDIEAAFGVEASADIAGLSIDELFADAEPETAQTSSVDRLAGLFDDPRSEAANAEADPEEEPKRISSVDISDLFDDESEGEIALQPSDPDVALEPVAPEPAPEPRTDEAFPVFGSVESEEEATMETRVEDLDVVSGDDFELLVSEDVLELDFEEEEDEGDASLQDAPPASAPLGPDAPEEEDTQTSDKRGLISRILGRK